MLVDHFHYVLVDVIVVVISRVLYAQPDAGCGSPVGLVTIFGR